jgi:hypothetical protein
LGKVGYWSGKEVTDYERKQRLLVPRKDEMLDAIVDLVPRAPEDAFTAVDVGAGQGALSLRLLDRFPRAHVVLVERYELFTGHRSERNLYLYAKLGYRQFKREPVHEALTVVYLENTLS